MRGGPRENTGPKPGSTNKLQITKYFSIKEIEDLVKEAKAQAKKDPAMMRFLIEQLFGKAKQPIVGGDEGDKPIAILSYVRGNDSNSKNTGT